VLYILILIILESRRDEHIFRTEQLQEFPLSSRGVVGCDAV